MFQFIVEPARLPEKVSAKAPRHSLMNHATWNYKVKINATGVWRATRGWGTQKDGARDEGLVSHWKDLVLKATGGYSGILGFRDTK